MKEIPLSFSLLNAAKNQEEWLANYSILYIYWKEAKLAERVYEARTKETRQFVDELIHETNSRLGTLRSIKALAEGGRGIDYPTLVRNVMTVFINVCAAELFLGAE